MISYKRVLYKLLPFGSLWQTVNSIFDSLLEALSIEGGRVHTSAESLVDESNPTLSVALLPDYEGFALADDEKPVGGETTLQRQQVVGAKMRTAYTGPSKAFFVGVGAKLGMVIQVFDGSELTGDDVARVEDALVDYDRVSDEGDLLRWQIHVVSDPNSQLTKLKAMVGRLKPAHTAVVYT